MLLDFIKPSKYLAIIVYIVLFLFTVLHGLVYLLAHIPKPFKKEERQYVTLLNSNENEKETLNEDKKNIKLNSRSISKPRPLPDLTTPASLKLSVIVPCYNEEDRLRVMLDDALPVLLKHYNKDGWEIIIVDDGSTDKTQLVAFSWAEENNIPEDQLRIVTLLSNRGKGGAVTHGMCSFRGEYALFADADGASRFLDITSLQQAVEEITNNNGMGIAIGSRAHLVKTEAVVKRSPIRNFLMYSLHTLLYLFGMRTISDTQCGFKLFTRKAAQSIFSVLHNEGWIFDVELLILAERLKIPVKEVPIAWHEVPGSKIVLSRDSICMAKDLVIIRLAYFYGVYDDKKKKILYAS